MLPWPEIITTGSSGCCSLTASSSCRPSSRLPCSQMSRNSRFGRRVVISSSAESLSRAVRVSIALVLQDARDQLADIGFVVDDEDVRRHGYSLACQLRDLRLRMLGRRSAADSFGGEAQPHPGAALAGATSRTRRAARSAAVLFENAADDREAKAGALLARRHIGLEQPVAVFLRQADAVVDHVDHDVVALARGRDADAAAAELGRRHGGDRLGGVLDDVGERLRDQPAVEARRHRVFGKLELEIDVGIADAHAGTRPAARCRRRPRRR